MRAYYVGDKEDDMRKMILAVMMVGAMLAPVALSQGAQNKPNQNTTEVRAKRQCKGFTKSGARCKRTVGVGKDGFCKDHRQK